MAEALEALEAKVGIDSSAVTTSLDYKENNSTTLFSYITDGASVSVDGTEYINK